MTKSRSNNTYQCVEGSPKGAPQYLSVDADKAGALIVWINEKIEIELNAAWQYAKKMDMEAMQGALHKIRRCVKMLNCIFGTNLIHGEDLDWIDSQGK